MKTATIKETYVKKAGTELSKALSIKNQMALPRVAKVVLNVGIGKMLKDQKRVEEVVASLEALSGQKVVMTRARKAIAGFKIREGQEVGVRVTLHGKRMWDFLDRLLLVALPRVRDFQGLSRGVIDQNGNANIGIKEHAVFPEIVPEKVQHLFSFQINIVTTAKNQEEGEALFRLIGLPLQKEENVTA
jgi:large subunit ribosomal protein L5